MKLLLDENISPLFINGIKERFPGSVDGQKKGSNEKNYFKGNIKNFKMIGKTVEELVEIWNQNYPDDPIKWKDKEKSL